MSGIKKVAPGLFQAPLAAVASELDDTLRDELDVIVIMTSPHLNIPSGNIPVLIAPIDDNAQGTDRLTYVQNIAQLVCDKRVLTVCHVGENRSGLLSALILVARGVASQEAVAIVQKNGPHNSPTQPHSFWNPGFVQQVLAL